MSIQTTTQAPATRGFKHIEVIGDVLHLPFVCPAVRSSNARKEWRACVDESAVPHSALSTFCARLRRRKWRKGGEASGGGGGDENGWTRRRVYMQAIADGEERTNERTNERRRYEACNGCREGRRAEDRMYLCDGGSGSGGGMYTCWAFFVISGAPQQS